MTQEKPDQPEQTEDTVNHDAPVQTERTESNPSEQLDKALADAAELRDNFLRAKAETENVRKRSADEVAKARKFAIEQFATELLAVRDSLELASQADLSQENEQATRQMHEGVVLTLKQLDSAFEKSGISLVDPAGEKFDPEKHQAMSMIETDSVEPNHVVDVLQKGYLLNDRLLRPAMVVVARAPSQSEGETANEDGTEA
jgi:molecular chaperone GrpE